MNRDKGITPEEARTLLDAVREMRRIQKAWFGGDKRLETLEASRKAERRVDSILDDITRGQGALFT